MSTDSHTTPPPTEMASGSLPVAARKSRRYFALPIAAACAAIIVTAFVWRASIGHANTSRPENPISTVAVAHVMREDLTREIVCEAELRPWQEIDLHAKVSGYLQKIEVDIGDKVNAGQLLATIEVPELADDIERGKAALKRSEQEAARARTTANAAHVVYARLASVDKSQPHLIAQQDLDASLEKDQGAASALAAANAQVDVARAELNKLRTIDRFSQITAPFSGVITRRFVDPGALIQAGTSGQSLPLVRLSQNDRLRLDIPISVTHVSLIQVGTPVDVRVTALDKSFAGAIARSTLKVDTATRTMEAEVDVPNADLKIIPGMYASVAIKLEHHDKALAVPIEAVSRKASSSVLVVTKNNCLEDRLVNTGLETARKIEILSGLNDNDLVVVGNRAQFRAGEHVQPKVIEQAAVTE